MTRIACVPRSLFTGTESGGECGVPHEKRFAMPRPSLDEPWLVNCNNLEFAYDWSFA